MSMIGQSRLDFLIGYLVYVSNEKIEEKERSKLHQLVGIMGGKVSMTIRKDLTCIIINGVGSKDYVSGSNLSINMIESGWLNECWKHKQLVPWDKYKVKPLTGLVFTCTGIPSQYRKSRIDVIKENGGKYIDDLNRDKTTHLVCNHPSGEKFKFAVQWGNVKIVPERWIDDCIKQNRWINEEKYLVKAQENVADKESILGKRDRNEIEDSQLSQLESINVLKNMDGENEGPDNSEANDKAKQKNSRTEDFTRSEDRVKSLPEIAKEMSDYVISTVPVSKFPAIELISLPKAERFKGKRFYIHGYPRDIQSYLVGYVIWAGGKPDLFFTPFVDYVSLGPQSDLLVQQEVFSTENPTYLVVVLLWFFRAYFERDDWMTIFPESYHHHFLD